MMFTTLISAATLALGPCNATKCANSQIVAPSVIEINAAMVEPTAVNRRQTRFSNQTRGEVIAVVAQDGTVNWPSSDRELLGGQDGPAQIYVRMFDGTFAIDPFQPLPAANDSTAQMLFRGTSLETDRTQHGRQQIDRTKELFRKLEQARVNWLRDNGYYNVRTFTNPKAEQNAESAKMPEPSAVFERPADVPRGKSREQVNAETQKMGDVASMLNSSDEPVRVSLPPHMQTQRVAGKIQRSGSQSSEKQEEVAIKE